MFCKNIIKKFVEIVSKYPESNAFCIDDTFYTYAFFWNLVCKQRTLIINQKLTDKKVGLVVNDDLFTYASIFAVWMEGMGYVPLHPKFPTDRNLEIIRQAELHKVLDSNIDSEFDDELVIQTNACKSLKPTTRIIDVQDDSLAYILFTSGSTGQPKGVQISFKNLDSFIDAFLDVGFKLDNTDRCLQCFDLTFDVSVQCFLVPLIHGACVYTVPHEQIKYSYVFGLLDDHDITFGIFAPSMINMLKPYFDEIDLKKLRYSILTAEASPIDLINEWAECIPNARVFNFYGPTEATIYCTCYEFIRNSFVKEANGMLAIGKPFKGVKAVILDGNLGIVDNGKKGEMYVSGNQVTQGYWKNHERNIEAFIELDYDGISHRFYKTGDLCLLDDDNDILYYGRLDNQVKIQGYRIELGEIEFHARRTIGGKSAVAFIYQGQTGSDEIALCLETDKLDKNAIIISLKAKLPSYMIPTKIYNLDKFPLNTSDKVDRKQLKELIIKL
ncbi:AMP-binding protein [Winogradskyella sp. F6397]|uniref:AMP-binding protein n=1 Tax=Winogradskyella marina TaxID=2785530 RepID=A0ABS0EGK6_9FLAO|nr:AMP-binding protein [Winogradskyella marina]MBF8149552.1 AMP-binding protein [Winogradskyella marina]